MRKSSNNKLIKLNPSTCENLDKIYGSFSQTNTWKDGLITKAIRKYEKVYFFSENILVITI